MNEVLLAYFFFRVLGYFVCESRQFLILTELKLHLLVGEELTERTVVE